MIAPSLRYIHVSFAWIFVPSILGALLGHAPGMIVGLAVGCGYLMAALYGADFLPHDLLGAKLMEAGEVFGVPESLATYCARAGIIEPSLYSIAIGEPNVIVWTSVAGNAQDTRIGISSNLESLLTPPEIDALVALAVARIVGSDVACATYGASMAGLALVGFLSRPVNATMDILPRDPDTQLTWVGGALVALLAPLSKTSLTASQTLDSTHWADDYAARMIGDPAALTSALCKLAAAGPDADTGRLRAYNPGLVPLFLVSPYEKLNAVASTSQWPAKVVSWLASSVPSVTERVEHLKELVIEPVDKADDRDAP